MKETKVEIVLVKPEGSVRKKADGGIEAVTDSYKKVMDTTVDLTTIKESHAIALEFSLKLLKELGFKIMITESNYKKLRDKPFTKEV